VNGRQPPEGEPLNFVRNSRTGAVHVCGHGPDSYYIPATRVTPVVQLVLSLISVPRQMVCGVRLLVGTDARHHAVWTAGCHFDDSDLCARCVHTMGDQSWRIFHADNRADDTEREDLVRHENGQPETDLELERAAKAGHTCPRCRTPRFNRCRSDDSERILLEHPHPERIQRAAVTAGTPAVSDSDG
jgi:hypothetical protein